MIRHGLLTLVLGCCLSAVKMALIAADQAQWGEAWSRNMVSNEKGLPVSFDPESGRNIKWSAQLGTETHSTPVVAGGRVFIGTNNGEPRDPKHQGDRGILMCFHEKTGRLLWQLVVPKREEDPYFDWPKSGISSPVSVEGDRVYLVSNRGEVMCLDAQGMANGNDGPYHDEGGHMAPKGGPPMEPGAADADILWLFDLTSGAGIWSHDAAHSSILVHGRYLYVNTGTGVDNTHKRIRAPDAPSLVVLDKATGRFVARDDERIGPRIFHCTWSSPSLGEVAGRTLVFFAGGDGVVYAFEALPQTASIRPTGRESAEVSPRIEVTNRGDSSGVRPSSSAAAVAATIAPDLSKELLARNAPAPEDGRTPQPEPVTEQVVKLKNVWRFDFDPAAPKENVHQYNTNRREGPSNIYGMPVFHQDRIYVAGGGDLFWGKNGAWLKCIDATKTGDITRNGEVWSYPLERHVFCTPALYAGLVFVADCGRKFHCLDAETGKPYWTHEITGEVWASPLVADGKVYFGTRSGAFWVFAASKEKKILSTIELKNPISATATAANGVLYVATMTHLYAVEKSSD